MATKTVTPNQRQKHLDWNLPKTLVTPKGEYRFMRRYLIIGTQPSTPGTPAAVVAQ